MILLILDVGLFCFVLFCWFVGLVCVFINVFIDIFVSVFGNVFVDVCFCGFICFGILAVRLLD